MEQIEEITGYEAIPKELQNYPNWIAYKIETVFDKDGKPKLDSKGKVKQTKKPYTPTTGMLADTTNPATWVDFETAIACEVNYDGLGFVFTSTPFVGIDLDDVGDEIKSFALGDLNNIVGEFHEDLKTYMEISPSGNGVHLIIKGKLPAGKRKIGNVEMYETDRYFTMTGNQLGEYDEVNSNVKKSLERLHTKYLGADNSVITDFSSFDAIPSYGNGLDAEAVLQALKTSKNGDKWIDLLLTGDWQKYGYSSRSDAELAVVSKLGFFSNYDKHVMDEICKSSILIDEKWERPSSPTKVYTIGKVIANRPSDGGYKAKIDFDFKLKEKVEPLNIEELAKKTAFCTWDDTGNAERFKIAFGDGFLYNTTTQEWYMYDEKVWQPDSMLMAESCATAVTEIMKHEPLNTSPRIDKKELEKLMEAKEKFINKTRNHINKMNMLKSARSLLPATEESFNNGGNIINLQNGYYDLDNDEFKGHNPEMMFTLISDATYEPEAECPLWEQFIYESFLGDADLIEYVQRAIGYSISNTTAERLIFFLFGQETGTGKSVLTNVLDELLGTYSQNIKPEALMIDRSKTGDSADPSFAKLKGARLVTTSESNESGKVDEGLIKRLTGGDKITARFLHKNEITYTPEFKIWMATNYKPIVQNNDSAIWQRLVVIPMENVVPASKADVNLTNKLKAEINGILNWAIEGYRQYKLNGLRRNEPEAIKEQRNTYHREMDIVGRFLDECCVLDSQASVKSSDIWNAYRIWCEGNNEYSGSNMKLSMELAKRFTKVKKPEGMYFLGIDYKK